MKTKPSDIQTGSGRSRSYPWHIHQFHDMAFLDPLSKVRAIDAGASDFPLLPDREETAALVGNDAGTGKISPICPGSCPPPVSLAGGVRTLWKKCSRALHSHSFRWTGSGPNIGCTRGLGKDQDEHQWYLITAGELLEIQRRLHDFDSLPAGEKRLSVLEIIGIITKVELRSA